MSIMYLGVEGCPLMFLNFINDLLYYCFPENPLEGGDRDWKLAGRDDHPLTYKFISSLLREKRNADTGLPKMDAP